ncbi:MAG: type II toxin-antitoxin system RelE/ParE family toxin [Armatimonadetes bacterium]|nr:type II toxin-antitoxin system RelE/ParE family toxin [Armatimonadota bacterium]
MAQRLIWSPKAAEDYSQAIEFLAERDPVQAAALADRLWNLIESMPEWPRLGRMVPEWGQENVRERIHQSYRIVYRVLEDDFIEVLQIHHTSQPLPDL